MNEFVNPKANAKPAGAYSHSVKVPANAEWLVMAGQVGVRDHVHIGDRAVLGAMAGIISDVPDDARWVGVPATPEREQMVKQVALARLPQMRKQLKVVVEKVAKLAATFRSIAQTTRSSALAIRCWPEFAMHYGVSPCAAMSYNMASGLITACEGDIMGAVTMLTLKAFGCEEMYLSDISQIFEPST